MLGFALESIFLGTEAVSGNAQSQFTSVPLRLCEGCGCTVTLGLPKLSILTLRRYAIKTCIRKKKGTREGHEPWTQRPLGWQESGQSLQPQLAVRLNTELGQDAEQGTRGHQDILWQEG